jgi:hypothetical protein
LNLLELKNTQISYHNKKQRFMAYDFSTTPNRRIDRLDRYAAYKSLNDNQITKECGLAVGTLGKSRKPGKDLSRKTSAIILENYKDLDRIWFLTGEGEMFTQPNKTTYPSYPLIDCATAECGKSFAIAYGVTSEELPRISIPNIPIETNFFIKASGYSMINTNRPELSIVPGAYVGLTKIDNGFIRWGDVYALATTDGFMIKRVVADPTDPEMVKLVSYNSEEYPEFTMRKDEIFEFARITCIVTSYIR